MDTHRPVPQLSSLVMAGDQPDYMVVTRFTLPHLVAEGLIQPLDDIVQPGFADRYPSTFRPTPEQTDFLGKMYLIQPSNYTLHPDGVFWNKDMFEQEGLLSLYEIFEDGSWDYDTLYDLAESLSRDTIGGQFLGDSASHRDAGNMYRIQCKLIQKPGISFAICRVV